MLINTKGQVKICDFGISGRLIDSVVHTRSVGCQSYMAPERINPDCSGTYDTRSDVWSLGISMFELSMDQFPYKRTDVFTLLQAIVNGTPPSLAKSSEAKYCFSIDYMKIIDMMLTKDVSLRPTLDMLLNSQIMKATLEKEGLQGARDTRTYFSAIIEEMLLTKKIIESSPKPLQS